MMEPRSRRSSRPATVGALVVGLLAILAVVLWATRPPASDPSAVGGSPTATLQPTAAVPTEQATPSASTLPPSTGPTATTSPSPVRESVASRIRIPRLAIDLPVIEGDGIDAPLDAAAHYPGTAWPGGGSNIYIYAHARDGLFIKLWDAREGDEVLLDTVDRRTVTYIVDDIRPMTPWNEVDLLKPTEQEQLTLQTSTSYTATAPRFVVIALPGP